MKKPKKYWIVFTDDKVQSYMAAEVRYSDQWVILRDDNGSNIYLFKADTVNSVSCIENAPDSTSL